jgi:23S rRNA (guanosine2251-2'-O)-methyltransferase
VFKNNFFLTENNIIYGRNPVLELLKSNKRSINKIILSKTARGAKISEIVNLAKKIGVSIHNVPPKKLDGFSKNSQGVLADVSPIKYVDLRKSIEKAKIAHKSLFVILDGINDPHNFGAIIRNCVVFDVDSIIVPKWRAVGVNNTVVKSSSGAVEYISISRVSNINQTISLLKKNGFLIIAGVQSDGCTLEKINLYFPMAIIIGNEGLGVSCLTRKKCDFLISIPQKKEISSLNASCASAIILYEISKARL